MYGSNFIIHYISSIFKKLSCIIEMQNIIKQNQNKNKVLIVFAGATYTRSDQLVRDPFMSRNNLINNSLLFSLRK